MYIDQHRINHIQSTQHNRGHYCWQFATCLGMVSHVRMHALLPVFFSTFTLGDPVSFYRLLGLSWVVRQETDGTLVLAISLSFRMLPVMLFCFAAEFGDCIRPKDP